MKLLKNNEREQEELLEENIELRELCLLGFDRSSAFIALLFLAREEECELYQDEFYGKLFVKKEQNKTKEEN